MWVRLGKESRDFGTQIFCPYLPPPQKESLLGRKPIDGSRYRFPRKRLQKRRVRDGQTAEIGDRLSFFKLAVALQPRLDLVSLN